MPPERQLNVDVGMRHILASEAELSDACPLALALAEKGFEDVWVEKSSVLFDVGQTRYQYKPLDPNAAHLLEHQFHQGTLASPGRISLTLIRRQKHVE